MLTWLHLRLGAGLDVVGAVLRDVVAPLEVLLLRGGRRSPLEIYGRSSYSYQDHARLQVGLNQDLTSEG